MLTSPYFHFLDRIGITLFRLSPTASSLVDFWIGCALLAIIGIILGEFCSIISYYFTRKHYLKLQADMVKAHNLSVKALQQQDKESYKAINLMAHEAFGKSFFAGMPMFIASILPLPFLLGWLDLRFAGMLFYSWDTPKIRIGYAGIFLLCYIPLRLLFSRYKKYIPPFNYTEKLRQKDQDSVGSIHSVLQEKE